MLIGDADASWLLVVSDAAVVAITVGAAAVVDVVVVAGAPLVVAEASLFKVVCSCSCF